MHIIIFHAPSIGQLAVIFSENTDQAWGIVKKRFVLIGAQRRKCLQPFLRSAAIIELGLFLFCCNTDLMFDFGITDHNKVPGLQVCSTGSSPCGEQTFFDNLARGWNIASNIT